jgi:hypothetical protein
MAGMVLLLLHVDHGLLVFLLLLLLPLLFEIELGQ